MPIDRYDRIDCHAASSCCISSALSTPPEQCFESSHWMIRDGRHTNLLHLQRLDQDFPRNYSRDCQQKGHPRYFTRQCNTQSLYYIRHWSKTSSRPRFEFKFSPHWLRSHKLLPRQRRLNAAMLLPQFGEAESAIKRIHYKILWDICVKFTNTFDSHHAGYIAQ